MLIGKKIILGISGSIAAYKSALIVRLLVKQGADVRVVMTPSSTQFIAPLTLATLSGKKVYTDFSEHDTWNNHVEMGRWADLMLIAPASANTIFKMANGVCDNLLTAVYLSRDCPVFFAPAMDEDMWRNTSVQYNVKRLVSFGHILLDVEKGQLASGLYGEGRMAEPDTIIENLSRFFSKPDSLRGKKALVTGGPTYEPLDPVRFIGNYSSGKTGIAIAEELALQGAEVDLILGPTNLQVQTHGIRVTPVNTASEMYDICMQKFTAADIIVMAAAVADYKPKISEIQKIKKAADKITLELEMTPDILYEMGKKKSKGQILVGFSLETQNEKQFTLEKLKSKNLDLIILNSLADKGAGFKHDTNKITIFGLEGKETIFPLKAKTDVAKDIVAAIIQLSHEHQELP